MRVIKSSEWRAKRMRRVLRALGQRLFLCDESLRRSGAVPRAGLGRSLTAPAAGRLGL